MKSFSPTFARRLDSLPRAWLFAVGLLALGVGFYLGAVLPDEQNLARLQHRVQVMQMQSMLAGKTERLDPKRQLAEFYVRFPVAESAPDWLGKIEAAAEKHRLEFLEGDYRFADEANGQLTRYQITLPLTGSYPDIRGFLKDVLSEVPAIALDNVSFQRRKIGDTTVRATVKMTLYLRRTS